PSATVSVISGCPWIVRSSSVLAPPARRIFSSARGSSASGTDSRPRPYRMAGMRPSARSLRAAPLPVLVRASTTSAVSDTEDLLDEQGAHALFVGDAADRLAEQVGDRNHADPPAGAGGLVQRDGVGDDQRVELALL